MDFEHIAIRPMEPRDNDELIARRNPKECSREGRIHFEPRIRRSFGTLARALHSPLEALIVFVQQADRVHSSLLQIRITDSSTIWI
jgi:hypothetical protein